MKISILSLPLLALLIACTSNAWAEVRLASIFTDHMVLQRDQPIQVWGWADTSQEVTVEFAGQAAKATAGNDGARAVTLQYDPGLPQ